MARDGYNATRVVTTAATQIVSDPASVTALLKTGAAAAVLDLHNGTATSAATRVASLSVPANDSMELSIPIRCGNGVKVKLSVNSAEAFIYVE